MTYAAARVSDGITRWRTRKIDARLATIEDDLDSGAIGGGAGAPTGASYVTIGSNASLSAERVLTAGSGISITDGGANSTITIAATGGQAFPIGSVFIGVVSTNPGTLLGYGTWSSIAAGRVLVGLDSGDTDFDTVEEVGGAKTVAAAGTVAAPTVSGSTAAEAAHTHAYTEVVNHTHPIASGQGSHVHAISTGTTDGAVARADSSSSAQAGTFNSAAATLPAMVTADPTGGVASGTTAAGASHSHGAGTLAASAPAFTGSATSVVQPFFVVYMWKRTA